MAERSTLVLALRRAVKILAATSDNPPYDAALLLLHVLGQTEATWLHAHPEQTLTATQQSSFEQLVSERAGGKPVAYLLGGAEFYGREFIVTPDVLIPRPATEDLIDQAKDVITQLSTKLGRPLIVADIGTGSGCIAITLACELTAKQLSHVYATDISPQALAVAQQNAERHQVTDRIEFFQGDLLSAIQDKPIDLIVSNPPYVPTAELEAAHQNPNPNTKGLTFEPREAFDGGADGMTHINQILALNVPTILEKQQGKIEVHHYTA